MVSAKTRRHHQQDLVFGGCTSVNTSACAATCIDKSAAFSAAAPAAVLGIAFTVGSVPFGCSEDAGVKVGAGVATVD